MLISLPHLPGASQPQQRSRAAAGLVPGSKFWKPSPSTERMWLASPALCQSLTEVASSCGLLSLTWGGSMAPGTQPARRCPTRLCSGCPQPQSTCRGGPDWWPRPGGLGEKLFALHTPGALFSSRTSLVELHCVSVCSHATPGPQTWVCPELPPRLRCRGSARDSGGSVKTTEGIWGSWRARCGMVEAMG